jgi:hypothetical protein
MVPSGPATLQRTTLSKNGAEPVHAAPFQVAIDAVRTPGIAVKLPPSTKCPAGLPGRSTTQGRWPLGKANPPSEVQVVPRKRRTAPVVVIRIRSPFASSSTMPGSPTGAGSAVQATPSNRCRMLGVSLPATTTPPALRVSECSTPFAVNVHGGFTPDHATPSQRATCSAAVGPDPVKPPTAIRSPFGRMSRSRTPGSSTGVAAAGVSPAPSGDQALPSQRATRLAGTPPACVNVPPANRSPPVPTTRLSIAPPATPAPSGCQAMPFHAAMPPATVAPAFPNDPAATRRLSGSTARACTGPSTPLPSGTQLPVAGS